MNKTQISRLKTVFHGKTLPEEGYLVGYAALIDVYTLRVPLPEKLALISHQHKRYESSGWVVYTPRHQPEDTLIGHLTFALRYEGVELGILHALFNQIDEEEIVKWVKLEPTGSYSRRVWFLFEWLMGKTLSLLSDATVGKFVDILDPKRYFTGPKEASKRHRIYNNLPGVRNFCPLVKRTEKLEKFIAQDLRSLVVKTTQMVPRDLLSRAAAFLVLKDSRASFAIEGEYPSQNRVERWADVLSQAGQFPLSIEELLRLQKILITDSRFVMLGLRNEGGFIGEHDRVTRMPIPEHISARWEDVHRLVESLFEMNKRLKDFDFDPVILAAMISFGFVFIHPLVDGNGRLHRYLMHHILVEKKFSPPGIIFPISAVILEHIHEYKEVLESYSYPHLKCIDWRPTDKNNVEILNDTIDLYRYFDATKQAEFFYDCVRQTIEEALPAEVDYLEKYDRMKSAINQRFDMPDYMIDLLIKFLEQNKGKLSKRARSKEFQALTSVECEDIEQLYEEIYDHKEE